MQFHRHTVQRRRPVARQALEFLVFDFPLILAQPVLFQHRLVRVDDDHTLIAIDDNHLVFADQRARIMQRHH